MRRSAAITLALGGAVLAGCGSNNASGGGGSSSTMSGTSTSMQGSGGGGVATGSSPVIAGCDVFPDTNPWNLDISAAALNTMSDTYIQNMSPSSGLHPDWGTVSEEYGIPYATGKGAPPVVMHWTASWGPTESDKLPCPNGGGQFCYPIPLTAPIEGGAKASSGDDRHVLYVDTTGAPSACTLYELYNAQNVDGASGWTAANGAIFHLGSNALRPDGWTSADAAGLSVLAGLVRLDEVMAGEVKHAVRLTVDSSSNGYIHPATHAAGDDNPSLPPMGLRLRLKASFDLSAFKGPSLVIFTAMKKYGVIVADNGSSWYITGESNQGWKPYMDDLVQNFEQLHGSDFEAVDTGPISKAGL